MKYLPFLILLTVVSVFACRNHPEYSEQTVVPTTVVTDTDDYTTADEAQFIADDTDGDTDYLDVYNTDASSIPKVKINYVLTTDTVAKSSTCGISDAKQKFKKRRVVNNDSVTTFFIRGYGFGPDNADSGRIRLWGKELGNKVYHQDDSLALVVTHWSDSLIVCSFPAIADYVYATTKGFSFKFLLYRRYKVKGVEKELKRTKACACIARSLASPYLCAAASISLSNAENNRRIDSMRRTVYNINEPAFYTLQGWQASPSDLQVGSVLGQYNDGNWSNACIVVALEVNSGYIFKIKTWEGMRNPRLFYYRKYVADYFGDHHPRYMECNESGTVSQGLSLGRDPYSYRR